MPSKTANDPVMQRSPSTANPRPAETSAEDSQEYALMINQVSDTRQAPPLGDFSTKRLTQLLFGCWRMGKLPAALTSRSASLSDVQHELRRRESLGVGVQL